MVRMRFSQNMYGYWSFCQKSYPTSWVLTAMQSVPIRMSSSLSPPPTKILDPPMKVLHGHRSLISLFPGRGKIVKHWPVRGSKRVGDHCFSVYLSNTYCRYKRLFGTPIAFSVWCSLWKIGPIFLDLLQMFYELMIKGDFKLWWFPTFAYEQTR